MTSALVVAEGHGRFLKRHDRTRALQFLAMVEVMRPMRVMSVGRKEQDAAASILRRFSDQDLTLTDAAGLHLMESLGLETCWSTDLHLGLTGVPLVIHQY